MCRESRKKHFPDLWLRVKNARAPKIDLTVEVLAVFGDGAALKIIFSHFVLTLREPLWIDVRFADDGGKALCS